MDTECLIVKDTQTLHSEMQTLVYENYNKFISATETIRQTKDYFKAMESEMNNLADNTKAITESSDQITGTLQETRSQLTKLSEKNSLLKRLSAISSLPAKLTVLVKENNYAQAVQEYNRAQRMELFCDSENTEKVIESLANTKEKTPMCLVNELSCFNKIQNQYRLIGEQGCHQISCFQYVRRHHNADQQRANIYTRHGIGSYRQIVYHES